MTASPLRPTRFPDRSTPSPKAHKGRAPNIVLVPRDQDGHDAGPKDGSPYFGIHKPFNLHPSVGKADVERKP